MSTVRFKRWLLNVARLRRRQVLRPLRRHIRHRALWSFEHHSVAKGAAIGAFFGILTPIAQIAFALLVAIVLRANLAAAALGTFVSNPFTLPIIYYWAYRLGAFLTGSREPNAEIDALAEAEDAAEAALEVQAWLPALLDWLSTVGPPLALGVLIVSTSVAVIAYVVVFSVWSLWAHTFRKKPPSDRQD